MNSAPIISIIVPAYNVALYLRKCLDSLINQTCRDIEIILINDGSTDETGTICSEYAKKDNRINFINKSNSGLSASRNVGIKSASGRYLMFVDADDWIDLETCEIAYRTAITHNVDVVLWSYIKEYSDKSIIKKILLKEGYLDKLETQDHIHRRMIGLLNKELKHPENSNTIVTAWSKLYKTDIIKNNSIYFIDTKIIGTEDALFNLQVFYYVNSTYSINKYFTHYRKNNQTSLTSKYKPEAYHRWQRLHLHMLSFINGNDLPVTFKLALNNRIALSIIGLGINEVSKDNSKSLSEKIRFIKYIITQPEYIEAYRKLSLKYFPLHWGIFFLFCKIRFALGIYVLLKLIIFLRKQ